MAEKAFRSHHHERLSPAAQDLPSQTMEILCRSRRLNDLNVIVRGNLQESLEARAGVFRSLPFHSMRQQQSDATEPAPLLFSGGDELIDDHLRHVPEIAELCFPEHQAVRHIETVAVFKTKYARLGKRTVVDL